MSVFTDISNALDTQLSALSPLPAVAWPNRTYIPVKGTKWIRPTLLPASSEVATIGETNSTDLNTGIYQVDVFIDAGEGKNDAMVQADLIADHFKRDTELTYNGRTVIIKNVGQSPSQTDNGWFQVPVNIEYQSYTLRR